MDELWHKLKWQEIVADRHGDSFQQTFETVMKAAHGDVFTSVRAAGPSGDCGCDGWLLTDSTCFAVYGPRLRGSRADIKRKIQRDLERAHSEWPSMKRWRFVHNDREAMRGDVFNVWHELRAEACIDSQTQVELLPPWSAEDVWQKLRGLGSEVRNHVLGVPPWEAADSWVATWEVKTGPAESAASRNVAFLVDNFPSDAKMYQPTTAAAFAIALVAYVLDDRDAFERAIKLLEHDLRHDAFESLLTCCVITNRTLNQAAMSADYTFDDVLCAIKHMNASADNLELLHGYASFTANDVAAIARD